MSTRSFQKLATAFIAASALVTWQCSRSSPSSPTSTNGAAPALSFALGDTTTSTVTEGQTKICKTGNVSGTFTIAKAVGNASIVSSPYDVPAGECRVVAENSSTTDFAQVSITETSAGLQSVSAICKTTSGTPQVFPFSNGGAVPVYNERGCVVTFNNFVATPPPTGNQGCTPGYWKQDQHFDSWQGYTTGADFDTTFGVNFFSPDITLLQALQLGGGGVNALARHGVAALLDAAGASGVNYAYTTAQVIDIVQGDGAYTGLTIDARKNLLAAANEGLGGCPLN